MIRYCLCAVCVAITLEAERGILTCLQWRQNGLRIKNMMVAVTPLKALQETLAKKKTVMSRLRIVKDSCWNPGPVTENPNPRESIKNLKYQWIFDLSRSLNVKCHCAIELAIIAFLLMFNSHIWPKWAPFRDIRLQNLSDIDFDQSRALQVKCDNAIGLSI